MIELILTLQAWCIGNWQPEPGATSSPDLEGAGGAESRLQEGRVSSKSVFARSFGGGGEFGCGKSVFEKRLREVIRWRGEIRLCVIKKRYLVAHTKVLHAMPAQCHKGFANETNILKPPGPSSLRALHGLVTTGVNENHPLGFKDGTPTGRYWYTLPNPIGIFP